VTYPNECPVFNMSWRKGERWPVQVVDFGREGVTLECWFGAGCFHRGHKAADLVPLTPAARDLLAAIRAELGQ
jgi:hypothetical protein